MTDIAKIPKESEIDYASRIFSDNRRGASYWGGCAQISITFKAAEEAGARARIAVRHAERLIEKRERRIVR